MTDNVIIPDFILDALAECHREGLIPSIRQGSGGNNHTVWFISFRINNRECAIKITSSYQRFLDFSYLGDPGVNPAFNTIKHCIRQVKKLT